MPRLSKNWYLIDMVVSFLNTLKKFQLSLHPPKELNMTETEIFLNGWKTEIQ